MSRLRERLGDAIRRRPAVFGVPFLLLIVGSSFGLSAITQVRYDAADGKKKQVANDEMLGLQGRRRKVDMREEYFRIQSQATEPWENVRVPRPEGVPEWGLPPESKKRRE